jgi:polyribonucleotide 5'-hydroxyl-kinase
VDRDASYMRDLRNAQVRAYFYGTVNMPLTPFTQIMDFSSITIYRIAEESSKGQHDYSPGGPGAPGHDEGDDADEDDEYDPMSAGTGIAGGLHERVEPSLALQNAMLAVTHADANASPEQIRDASVLCYVYVADVDDKKRRMKLLSPINGRIPAKAIVWGAWPEPVSGLVS